MTSEPIRDPNTDHLLTPQNAAFIIIDYQPIQVSSIRSMDQKELVFNIVHTAKAVVNYKLPIVHSTVNIATGKNKLDQGPEIEFKRLISLSPRTQAAPSTSCENVANSPAQRACTLNCRAGSHKKRRQHSRSLRSCKWHGYRRLLKNR